MGRQRRVTKKFAKKRKSRLATPEPKNKLTVSASDSNLLRVVGLTPIVAPSPRRSSVPIAQPRKLLFNRKGAQKVKLDSKLAKVIGKSTCPSEQSLETPEITRSPTKPLTKISVFAKSVPVILDSCERVVYDFRKLQKECATLPRPRLSIRKRA